ncbi:MAG: CHAT domain-containing protein [Pseudomonadota bacterium]
MAYFTNNGVQFQQTINQHAASSHRAPATQEDYLHLAHLYALALRQARLLNDVATVEAMLATVQEIIAAIADPTERKRLRARYAVEQAESFLTRGRPRDAARALAAIAPEVAPAWLGPKPTDHLYTSAEQIVARNPRLAADVFSAAARTELLVVQASAALTHAQRARALYSPPGSTPAELVAHLRYFTALNQLADPDAADEIAAFFARFGSQGTQWRVKMPLLTVQAFFEFGGGLLGEEVASNSAAMGAQLINAAELPPAHPLALANAYQQAEAALQLGDVQAAFTGLTQLFDLMAEAGVEESLLMSDIFMNVGLSLAYMGDPESAQELAATGADISARLAGPTTQHYRIAKSDLAGVLSAAGQHAQAVALADELVPDLTQNGAISGLLPAWFAGLAEVYEAAGDRARAIALYERALEQNRDTPLTGMAENAIWEGYSAVLAQTDQLEKALAATRKTVALAKAEAEREKKVALMAQFDAGASTRLRTKRRIERSTFHRLIALLSRVTDPNVTARADEALQAVQWANGSAVEDALVRVRLRELSQNGALARLLRAEQNQQLVLQRTAAKLTSLKSRRAEADEAAVAALEEQIEAELETARALKAQIDREFPQATTTGGVSVLTLADIQSSLRPGQALLVFAETEADVFAFAVSQAGVAFERLALSSEQLTQKVKALREGLGTWANVRGAAARQRQSGPSFDRRLAHELHTTLIAPFDAQLAGQREVFVFAQGALSSLPLSLLVRSLPRGADNDAAALRSTDWLVRHHAFITLPSLSALTLERRAQRPAEGGQARFVGFGDPLLGGAGQGTRALPPNASALFEGDLAKTEAVRALSALPATRTELERIAQTIGPANSALFLGAAATEAAFKATTFPAGATVSVATHGLVAGELSGLSEPALVFTPPDTATAKDDGLLTASELALLALPVSWLILSACNTAAGDGTPGAEGLAGLASAALFAGAQSLLVSHWPVLDNTAADITTDVLGQMALDDRLSRAQALQQAMINVLEDDRSPQNSHPGAWAPFVLVSPGN